MVGRPRSTGCSTCRTRHLKCDGKRPICSRCEKDKFECGPRSDKLQVIEYRPPKSQSRERIATAPSFSTRPEQSRPSPVTDAESEAVGTQQPFEVSATGTSDNALNALSSEVTTVWKGSRVATDIHFTDVSTWAWKMVVADDNVYIAHLNHALFSQEDSRVRWVGFNAIAQPNSLSWKCLLALSKSFYGRVQNETSMIRQGIGMYGQCLTSIHKRISCVEKNAVTDVVLSILIMGFYEATQMMLCTSHDAWVRHGLGISILIQIQGPEACRDRTMFEIFRSSRFLIILSSLAVRCPTYLSGDSWRTVPWQQQTVPKDNMDLLLDIMSEVPALRSRLFELQGNTGADNYGTSSFYQLAEDALQVASQLQIWRGDWDVSPEGHIIELTESEPAKRLGEKSLHFTSLYAANCCSLCDASLILVLETVLLCAQPGQLNPGMATTLFETSRQAAIEICQSLDYQLQNPHTRLGQLFVLWPLREAGKILAKGRTSEQLLLEQQKQKLATGQDAWEIARSAFGKYG
ncbi:hypothetical protein D6C84_01342 [Aureobasidium pullulans]|uniref:Zn(2)-C6 fungal-type domain-containing protein n=1 Tax=Aureobasidium pullulans TaxID=5580 RepID=A0A4S9Y887_AURPU|nr:hypothetical protein D6C84_01342 [Aureobasidium pullulans]